MPFSASDLPWWGWLFVAVGATVPAWVGWAVIRLGKSWFGGSGVDDFVIKGIFFITGGSLLVAAVLTAVGSGLIGIVRFIKWAWEGP